MDQAQHADSRPEWGRGYVQVYTGNGKGKTTAAIGLAVRAAGAGIRVFLGQFIKGKPTSEIRALKRFEDLVAVRQFGRGCFITGTPDEADVEAALAGLAESRKIVAAGKYPLVILDEINVAVQLGLAPVEQVLELIKTKPPAVELVLTGRKADVRIMEKANLVTEMRDVKHYFSDGVHARRGIES